VTPPVDPSAAYYARLCARAYNDPPTYGAADSAGRANVYAGDVVFRGTNNTASALADSDILVADTPLGRLHQGFWQAWLPLEAQLLALAPQRLAGHSEGAPIALEYAGMLCRAGKPPSIVYAFESPRFCADDRLYKLLDAHGVTVFATCNVIDPVPWVPPELTFPWTLAHIGRFDPAHLDPAWYHLIDNVIQSLGR
jgi:hypothetical protein